jgi:hypothetical protein
VLANVGVVLGKRGSRLLPRLRPNSSEAEGKHELTVAGGEIDLAGEGNISVFRAGVLPLHLKMLR